MSSTESRIQFKHRLGAEIARRRELKGWKQTDLARQVGIQSASVSAWERGQVSPQVAILVEVAAALDTTLPDLLAPALDPDAKPRPHVKPDPRRNLIFYEFTARVAGHKWLRRAVIALAEEEGERKEFEKAMRRAEEIR